MSDSSDRMSLVVNWQKLSLILAVLAVMTTLLLANVVEWEQVSAPFGLIVGAALQNGIGGAKGHTTAPLVQPAEPRRRATDSGPVTIVPTDHGLDVRSTELADLPTDPYAD